MPTLSRRKFLFPLAGICAGFCAFVLADTAVLSTRDASYAPETGVLTLPLLNAGSTSYAGLKIKIEKFSVIDPGQVIECPLEGITAGKPLNYACADDLPMTQALLQGTWRGSSLAKGAVELRFNGNTLSGSIASFTQNIHTADDQGIPITQQKQYTRCTISGPEATGAPLSYLLRYSLTQFDCAEGPVSLSISNPFLPPTSPRTPMPLSLFVYATGGKNRIDELSLLIDFEFIGKENISLRKQ